MRTNEYELAVTHADQALAIEPYNPKALFRKAKAQLKIEDYLACSTTLQDVLNIDRKDPQIRELFEELVQKQQGDRKQDDPDDALRCIREFSAGEFPNLLATSLAAEFLTKWIIATDKTEYLQQREILTYTTSALKRLTSKDPNAIKQSQSVTATLERVLQLSLVLLIDRKSSVHFPKDPDEEETYKRERALTMYDERKIDSKVSERRKIFLKNLDGCEMFQRVVRDYIRQGISDARNDEQRLLRKECVGNIIDIVHNISNLDDSDALKVMSLGLDAVECPSIRQKALSRLSIMCDDRRRLGLSIGALPLTHGLNLCLEALIGMICDKSQDVVEFALTAIFHLLADKERNDSIDWNSILDKYILDRFTKTPEERMIAFKVLNLLWLADRNIVCQYSVNNQLPLIALNTGLFSPKYADAQVRQVCIEFLMNTVEMSATRVLLIPSVDSILDHYDTNPESRGHFGEILAGLCLHEGDLRVLIFDKVDFLELSSALHKAIDLGSKKESHRLISSLLKITYLLSVHSKFKEDLLSRFDQTWLIMLGQQILKNKLNDSGQSHYMYVGILWNLTRSQEDKDRLKKTKGGPDLDDSQLEQLRMIYDKLPKEAKFDDGNQFDRGNQGLAYQFKAKLINNGSIVSIVSEMTQKSFSPTLIKLAAMFIRNIISHHQELRAACYAQGGFKIVKAAIENLKISEATNAEDLRDLRQLVAYFGISIRPDIFPYHSLMSMVVNLGILLEDSYELYQYEGALALTNLASAHEEVRVQLWKSRRKTILSGIILSDNDMLRAAGWELYCNMAFSDDVTRDLELASDVHYCLGIALQFSADVENPRAWSACAGFLAFASANLGLAKIIVQHDNLDTAIMAIDLAIKASNRDVEDRLVRLFLNIYAVAETQKSRLTVLFALILPQLASENAQTVNTALQTEL